MSSIPKYAKANESPERRGSRYPAPHDALCQGRVKNILGDQFGLTQFGVNLATLEPGVWSSQRHWHEGEDEFIYVLSGELVLADDAGEHVLTPGMCAGFKAGNGNGHCLKNLSGKTAVYLEVGTRLPDDVAHYSDIDMKAVKRNGAFRFVRRDGGSF
jgi:uncharacterized cupin superfamily protein